MKKQFLFFGLVFILLTACTTKDEPIVEDSLVGTYYSAFAYTGGGYNIAGIYIAPYDVYWSYRFIDKTNAERTANEKFPYGSLIGSPKQYTYTYSYPDIELIDEDGNVKNGTFISKSVFRIGNDNYQKQP